jgi:peptide/nickel transport system substrate-binding protein
MKFRSPITAVAVLAAAGLTLSGCAAGAPEPGASGSSSGDASAPTQTLTLGALADVTDWDPAQAHVGHLLQPYQAAYDTLLLREPDGTLAPMLATEWTYDDTNTQLTLELRTDVTFSDGEAFDAEAVVANFEHFKAENGRQAAQLASLESATAVDADTVEITLSEPDPAFTYFLSQAAGLMGSPAALDGDAIGAAPVGSGPYVMDTASTVAGSQYVFTAREDYWNPDLQKFAGITFKFLVDNAARANALVSGQINAALIDARSTAQVDGAGNLTRIAYPTDWVGLLLLDRDGALVPELADVRVRQAINHALDREALLQALQLGYGTPTAQPFGPESGAFDEELEDAYPYDPERARELLAEAGYADGFTMTAPSVGAFETFFATIGQQLSEVGITLQAVPVPDQDLVSEIASGKFPSAFFFLFQGEAWVAINQIVSTDALYNSLDSTTPELQTLIDAVQAATTEEELQAAAVEVNRYVVEQAWFAPLYRPDQLFYTDATVTVEPQVQQAVPSVYNFAPAQ